MDAQGLKLLEIFLLQDQLKFISSHLPKGYSLHIVKNQSDNQASRSKRKDSTSKISNPQKKVKKEPIPVQQQFDNFSQDDTLNYDQLTQPQLLKRHSVRDKKQKVPFEHKYPELQPNQPDKKFKSNDDLLKKCFKVLQLVKRHKSAEPFLYPVDPIALNIPDYLDIIKEPMDLSTIEKNFKNNVYREGKEFRNDMRKIFENSLTYNQKGSAIYFMTIELQQFFQKSMKDLETQFSVVEPDGSLNINELQKKVEKLQREIKELNNRGGPGGGNKKFGGGNFGGGDSRQKNIINLKPMSQAEKRTLGQNIRKLPAECLNGVWQIVCDGNKQLQSNKDELEFDIDTLSPKKARELEKFVKQKLQQLNKQNSKNKKKQSKQKVKNSYEDSLKQDNFNILNYNEDAQQYPLQEQKSQIEMDNQFNNIDLRQMNAMSSSPQQIQQDTNQQQLLQQEDSKSSDSSFITDSEDEGNQNS